ncbi:N-alpha-acetyltransferase 38, NatC auxiliary subunit [Neocloeon triangulifer]|uniref:N-alpha-acetyltransferase 38, NatC auxiliary subunit n=1 Tax=Neocloeon triangulifer TaxID=2078957 RepID=UPI00286F01E1|nr:N-alpha-acetyltransferase 38, NatC auxiliary subunit [Neocloeon triangulifer]
MKMEGSAENVSTNSESPTRDTPGREKLRSWLNRTLKIEMTDGRVLIGSFLCTDRDANVILGNCREYLGGDELSTTEEPRVLGLVMVPGRHIVTVHIDEMPYYCSKEEIV